MAADKFILMLEDDPDDIELTRSVVEETGIDLPISFVSNSTELFAALGKASLPALILVDFNAAPEGAVRILEKLKQDDRLKGIPVAVLGESETSRFVSECYRAGAAAFVQKPASMEQSREKIRSFFHYWRHIAALP